MPQMKSLSLYERMARLSWPRTYLGKFLLTAFVGVHVPLIAVVGMSRCVPAGGSLRFPYSP